MAATVWDAAKHIDTKEAIEVYLKTAYEEDLFFEFLGDVARSKGLKDWAKELKIPKSVFEAPGGAFETALKVAELLGYKLTVKKVASTEKSDKEKVAV